MLYTIKKIFLVAILPLMLSAQNFSTLVNQSVSGNALTIDFFLIKESTSDIYLGNSDFVFTFTSTNFTSPVVTVLQPGAPGGIIENYYSVDASIVAGNRLVVNIIPPTVTTQSKFNAQIQKIEAAPGTFIAQITISGISSSSNNSDLAWRSASPNNTIVYSLANASPWNGTDVTSTISFPAIDNIALPVELTSFSAMSKGRNVVLNWKTATEINSSSFEVERNDGKTWSKVSDVKASGTSNAPKEYSYVDMIKSAVSGNISYRLKMIDNDGKYEYSTIAEVKIVPTVYSLEQNYPNPFNPETKIQYSLPMDAKVSLKVYDMVGREVASVVNEQQAAGFYEQKFGGYNFSSGVYFYRIVAESGGKIAFTSIKKMVMIK